MEKIKMIDFKEANRLTVVINPKTLRKSFN